MLPIFFPGNWTIKFLGKKELIFFLIRSRLCPWQGCGGISLEGQTFNTIKQTTNLDLQWIPSCFNWSTWTSLLRKRTRVSLACAGPAGPVADTWKERVCFHNSLGRVRLLWGIIPPNSGQFVMVLISQIKSSQLLCWHTVWGGFRGIETYMRDGKADCAAASTIYDIVIRAHRNYSKHFLMRAASKGFVPRCSRGRENSIQECFLSFFLLLNPPAPLKGTLSRNGHFDQVGGKCFLI